MTVLSLVRKSERMLDNTPLRKILNANAMHMVKSILVHKKNDIIVVSIEMNIRGDYRVHRIESEYSSVDLAVDIVEGYANRHCANDPKSNEHLAFFIKNIKSEPIGKKQFYVSL